VFSVNELVRTVTIKVSVKSYRNSPSRPLNKLQTKGGSGDFVSGWFPEKKQGLPKKGNSYSSNYFRGGNETRQLFFVSEIYFRQVLRRQTERTKIFGQGKKDENGQ